MAAGCTTNLALHNKKSPMKLKSNISYYSSPQNTTIKDKLSTKSANKQPTKSSLALKKSLDLKETPNTTTTSTSPPPALAAFNKLANNTEQLANNNSSTTQLSATPFSINNVSTFKNNTSNIKQVPQVLATALNAASFNNQKAKSINLLRPPLKLNKTACNTSNITTTILKTSSINSLTNNQNFNDLSTCPASVASVHTKKVNFLIPELGKLMEPTNSSNSEDKNNEICLENSKEPKEQHLAKPEQHVEKHLSNDIKQTEKQMFKAADPTKQQLKVSDKTLNLIDKNSQFTKDNMLQNLSNNVYKQAANKHQQQHHMFLNKNIIYNGTFPIDMPLQTRFNNYDPEANCSSEDYRNYEAYKSSSNDEDDEDDGEDDDEDEESDYEEQHFLVQDLESVNLTKYGIIKANTKTNTKPLTSNSQQKPPQVWSMQELINDPSIPLNYKKMCNEVEQSLQEFEHFIDNKNNADDKMFKSKKPPTLRTFNIDDPIDLKKNI